MRSIDIWFLLENACAFIICTQRVVLVKLERRDPAISICISGTAFYVVNEICPCCIWPFRPSLDALAALSTKAVIFSRGAYTARFRIICCKGTEEMPRRSAMAWDCYLTQQTSLRGPLFKRKLSEHHLSTHGPRGQRHWANA